MPISGFDAHRIKANGISHAVHIGGAGDPVVLLHGFPQNHRCWSRIAPRLAEKHLVIVPDLRGYGDSDAPKDDARHEAYSKRTMAKDLVGLLDALEIARAHIVGHDRGARVAYRFALDHPARTARLAILEVVPTGDFWASWTADLALAAYHWTFLAQPAPLPERMILADGSSYVDWTLASWTKRRDLSVFSRDALESYRAQGKDPARVSAMCADYRAGAFFDRRLDEADAVNRVKIDAPLLFLWAEGGFPDRTGAPLSLWQNWAADLRGHAIPDCGHFVLDEAPDPVFAALEPFLRS